MNRSLAPAAGMQAQRAGGFLSLLYFDHNATTSLAPEVVEIFTTALRDVYGNASSTHAAGQVARQRLEDARGRIARTLNASPSEFLFTSGGTESNNLAILGLVRAICAPRKHVVTTAIEHPAVLEPCRQLEREGVAVSYLPVSADGLIDTHQLRSAIGPETVLLSVMHANNEVGTIEPLTEIARLVRELRAAGQQIFFHSDGVQALGKIPVDLRQLGVDLYSVSAHKIHAPKGIGSVYVRKGTPLGAIQFGGRQERERRPGTENVPAAIAFATALDLCDAGAPTHVQSLRDHFESAILRSGIDAEVNGAVESRLPNTSNVLFRGVSAEAVVIALDMAGIAVSTGSACSSGSIEPSHVLLAMGRSRQEARSSIRFSFGRYNTLEEVDALIEATLRSVRRARTLNNREAALAV